MPSPFPGMNPYLEHPAIWPDVHLSLIYLFREILAPQVSPHYVVRAEAQLYIHELPHDTGQLMGRGDVGISHLPDFDDGTHVAVLTAPVWGTLPTVDVERVHFLEIRDVLNRQVVTVIELLSPSDKKGQDREQYIAKRTRLQSAGVNFVEIDLLRGGTRPPVQGLPLCDYYAMVSRPDDWPNVGLWPIHLRDRLPTISIPLRDRDRCVELDLQAALNRVYDAAYYEDDISRIEPEPPLSVQDAEWARQFVP